MKAPDGTPGWYWEDAAPAAAVSAPVVLYAHVDDNPVVAPDGAPRRVMHARPLVPFGFQR